MGQRVPNDAPNSSIILVPSKLVEKRVGKEENRIAARGFSARISFSPTFRSLLD